MRRIIYNYSSTNVNWKINSDFQEKKLWSIFRSEIAKAIYVIKKVLIRKRRNFEDRMKVFEYMGRYFSLKFNDKMLYTIVQSTFLCQLWVICILQILKYVKPHANIRWNIGSLNVIWLSSKDTIVHLSNVNYSIVIELLLLLIWQ